MVGASICNSKLTGEERKETLLRREKWSAAACKTNCTQSFHFSYLAGPSQDWNVLWGELHVHDECCAVLSSNTKLHRGDDTSETTIPLPCMKDGRGFVFLELCALSQINIVRAVKEPPVSYILQAASRLQHNPSVIGWCGWLVMLCFHPREFRPSHDF